MTKEEWNELGVSEDEHYLVRAIRTRLLTPEQKQTLFDRDLSIEDILNGRFDETNEDYIAKIFKEWNEALGWKEFGF